MAGLAVAAATAAVTVARRISDMLKRSMRELNQAAVI
jgi:hypothetical protein